MISPKINYLSIILLFSLFSCAEKEVKEVKSTTENVDEKVISLDNSQNSLDWKGTYNGILPCADCAGIETKVTLNNDLTFNIESKYLGKSNEVLSQSGTFTWNAIGSHISLDIKENPVKFFVGENQLTQLDLNGELVVGELAGEYVLKKSEANIIDIKWRLVELYEKPVEAGKGLDVSPHVTFESATLKLRGNSGCNNITGKFELSGSGNIKSNNIFATMNSCADSDTENLFQRALRNMQSYEIIGNELILTEPEWPKAAVLVME